VAAKHPNRPGFWENADAHGFWLLRAKEPTNPLSSGFSRQKPLFVPRWENERSFFAFNVNEHFEIMSMKSYIDDFMIDSEGDRDRPHQNPTQDSGTF